jgi:hypothetical protein
MSGLDFVLMQNPDSWSESTDQQTSLAIDYLGWEALFFKVLGCPDTERIEDESREAFDERYDQNFREAIPDYPLLSRISHFYRDVWYASTELMQLRNECQSVLNKTSDKEAIKALNTLIAGCNEAQQHGLGLFLGAD